MAKPNEVIVRGGERGFVTEIMARGHQLIADEPACLEHGVPVPLRLGLEDGLHLGEARV